MPYWLMHSCSIIKHPKGVCGNLPQLLVKITQSVNWQRTQFHLRVSANYSAGIINFIKWNVLFKCKIQILKLCRTSEDTRSSFFPQSSRREILQLFIIFYRRRVTLRRRKTMTNFRRYPFISEWKLTVTLWSLNLIRSVRLTYWRTQAVSECNEIITRRNLSHSGRSVPVVLSNPEITSRV